MKQSVDPSKYDQQYFRKRQEFSTYDQLKKPEEFSHIYQKAGSMLKLEKNDKVVDLGCGSGQLAFYLYLKYGCDVTGIDYSRDAIAICQNNLNELASRSEFSDIANKVRFLQVDNEHLADFEDAKAVFWIDVVEHLYDHEIEEVLGKIKKWKSKKGMYIVIHTDNNNYLRFIRPITDWLAVWLGKTTREDIGKIKKHEQERHINLTTARKISKKLEKHGFKVQKIKYPAMDIEIVRAQLGGLGRSFIILHLVYFLGKAAYFLRPSFYILAVG